MTTKRKTTKRKGTKKTTAKPTVKKKTVAKKCTKKPKTGELDGIKRAGIKKVIKTLKSKITELEKKIG